LTAHEDKRIQHGYTQKLQAIEQAYQYLYEQDERITVEAIGRRIGLSHTELVRHELLWKRVITLVTLYKQQHEAQYLVRVEDAVHRFRQGKQPVTLVAIGQFVGMAHQNLKRYPTILAFLNGLPELPTPLTPPKR
jgi:hypothetical protein